MSSNEAFNTAIKKLWDDWTEVVNEDGVLDYYGMLALAVRERRENQNRSPTTSATVPRSFLANMRNKSAGRGK